MSLGPAVPSFINRVNFITAFFWQGCEAPLTLFCKFAAPPAGRAVALIIGLDWEDIVKEFWRPAGLRSHRHGRKGPRGKSKVPDLPDPNEAIAKNIPGRDLIAGRRWGSPTFYAFEISDNLDRVAFNVAIFDVVTDTTYQALLGILSVDNSNCPWVARGASHGEYSTILNTGLGWGNKVLAYVDYEHRLDMRAAGVDLPTGGTYLITFEMSFYQAHWPETRVQIALRDQLTGEILEESGLVTLRLGDTVTLNVAVTAQGGRQIQWLVRSQLNQTDTPMQKASAVQVSQ